MTGAYMQVLPFPFRFSWTAAIDSHMQNAVRAYQASQSWINKEHVIGRAKGYLPYIGMVTIIMNDYPMIKYILVGLMGLFVLTTKE